MNTTASTHPIPEEINEMICRLETTYTIEEVYAIYEDWLNSMEFSPDYIIN